jgi:hypothetical protein
MGKEVPSITNIFKNTYAQIAYTTKNNIWKLLAAAPHNCNPDLYERSGVYGLICQTCQRRCVGQTERPSRVRFKEHIQDYNQRTKKSYFAKHLLEHNHPLHPIEETMEIINTTGKGRMLNVIEKYYIYKVTAENNQLNDRLTATPNAIFDTLLCSMDTHSTPY